MCVRVCVCVRVRVCAWHVGAYAWRPTTSRCGCWARRCVEADLPVSVRICIAACELGNITAMLRVTRAQDRAGVLAAGAHHTRGVAIGAGAVALPPQGGGASRPDADGVPSEQLRKGCRTRTGRVPRRCPLATGAPRCGDHRSSMTFVSGQSSRTGECS